MPKMSEKTTSVFISHSSKDNDFALWLAGELRKYGVEVWMDAHKLRPGDPLYGTIGPALKEADHFIIILSESSIDSPWVELELEVALIREKKEKRRNIIIPVLLENIEVPTFIENKKYSDFTSRENFEYELGDLLGVFGIEPKEVPEKGDTRKKARLYPDNFLPDLRFFVGRGPLLDTIRETLAVDHRAVMHDISGLGKTFASYKLAADNTVGYERIFLVRATKEEWLESLARCGESINPELANLTEQAAKANGFKQWLEENENWLVIYDNVDLPEELSFYVPNSDLGDCLFTSNSSNAAFLGTEIGIDKMNATDAGILLYSRALGKRLQSPDLDGEEKSAFDNLIREIDGLPVTLNATGAVIFKRKLNFTRFWEIYGKTPEIAWEGEDPYSTYQHKSAGKIFSFVYDELCGTEYLGKAVKTILDSMSFFSPDEIPEELLQEILKAQDESFAQNEESDDLWDDIREKLTAYDLLKYDKQKKTFTTHRAIQRVILSRLKNKEKDFCVALASILNGLFPTYDYSNREVCEKYYQHVIALLEKTDKFRVETKDINGLYSLLGTYQWRLGNYVLAEESYRRAAEISTSVFGAESDFHARDLNDLALVYQDQGRYDEAMETHEDALRIAEKANGKEHRYYATYLNNLAKVYATLGRDDDAIEKLEEALQIAEKTIGKEHPDYAIHLNDLGLVYANQGRYDEAIKKYAETLRIAEKTIGKAHPFYAIHLHNLANLYYGRGKFDEALDFNKNALQIFENSLPESHPHTAKLRRAVEKCRKKLESS